LVNLFEFQFILNLVVTVSTS